MCTLNPLGILNFFPKRLPLAVPKNSHHFLSFSHLMWCISILQVILDPSSFLLFLSLPLPPSCTFFTDMETDIGMAKFFRVESWGWGEAARYALQAFKHRHRFFKLSGETCQFGNPHRIFFCIALASLIAE